MVTPAYHAGQENRRSRIQVIIIHFCYRQHEIYDLVVTLKRLEQIGLISRQVYPEVPPRVEYSLTARGQSLMPHVSALIGWALEHFEEIAK